MRQFIGRLAFLGGEGLFFVAECQLLLGSTTIPALEAFLLAWRWRVVITPYSSNKSKASEPLAEDVYYPATCRLPACRSRIPAHHRRSATRSPSLSAQSLTQCGQRKKKRETLSTESLRVLISHTLLLPLPSLPSPKLLFPLQSFDILSSTSVPFRQATTAHTHHNGCQWLRLCAVRVPQGGLSIPLMPQIPLILLQWHDGPSPSKTRS